jgi:hypothetical protein
VGLDDNIQLDTIKTKTVSATVRISEMKPVRLRLKCDGKREENRFSFFGKTDESI